jgi:hypothetical protein
MVEYSWMQEKDEYCNISESIASKVGMRLHQKHNHPLNIIKKEIEGYFEDLHTKHG